TRGTRLVHRRRLRGMRHAAGGHTWTPPRLQRLSFVVGQSGEDCRHTSGLLARCASALMECAGWLLYKSCELEARCPRQVRPAPVLPVLPSTIDCQSNLVEGCSLFLASNCPECAATRPAACTRVRTPCPKTATPRRDVHSCWPLRPPQHCDADGRPTCRATYPLAPASFGPVAPALAHHGSATFADTHRLAC